MCKYNVESLFPENMSVDDIKKIICKKIVRVIFWNDKLF